MFYIDLRIRYVYYTLQTPLDPMITVMGLTFCTQPFILQDYDIICNQMDMDTMSRYTLNGSDIPEREACLRMICSYVKNISSFGASKHPVVEGEDRISKLLKFMLNSKLLVLNEVSDMVPVSSEDATHPVVVHDDDLVVLNDDSDVALKFSEDAIEFDLYDVDTVVEPAVEWISDITEGLSLSSVLIDNIDMD